MKSYESSAKTVEEAISQGLAHFGAAINDVTIDILSEGSKGLFGLFGSKQAKVRLTLKAEPAVKDASALIAAAHERAKQEYEVPATKTVKAPSPAPSAKPAAREARENKEAKENRPPISAPVLAAAVKTAEDFLQQLVSHMGVEATITSSSNEDGSIFLEMAGENMGLLIGHHGETLDALQYLTNLHTNKGQADYIRVNLDTENYRAKREESLIRLANRMANRAVKTGRRVTLEPMNPYERRIIHSALHENRSVDTHSEGNDPYRRLVITAKRK